jgi:hypothetical protein
LLLAWVVQQINNARAMASVLTTPVSAESHTDLRAEQHRLPVPADPPLFQFGLRQLLLFVTAICVLLSAMASSSGLTSLILLLAVAVVVMHVFATALGTKLQSRIEQERLRREATQPTLYESRARATEQSAKLQAIRSGPRSPWHGRGSTYLPWLPRLVVSAMVIGGLVGGVLLGGMIGHRTSIEGIIVGAASFAVLGGWTSFLCGSFYGVFRHGFREALAEEQRNQAH